MDTSNAGQTFGAVLNSFVLVHLTCAALCAVSSLGLLERAWFPRLRAGAVVLMFALAATHDLYVLPAAHQARGDKEKFETLHRASVGMVGTILVLGLGTLVASAALNPQTCNRPPAG